MKKEHWMGIHPGRKEAEAEAGLKNYSYSAGLGEGRKQSQISERENGSSNYFCL